MELFVVTSQNGWYINLMKNAYFVVLTRLSRPKCNMTETVSIKRQNVRAIREENHSLEISYTFGWNLFVFWEIWHPVQIFVFSLESCTYSNTF